MRVLGLIIATGGGVAIGFGWAGAAQVDCVECQIPFLLSGGAAGIGLIIFGVSLLLLAQIRTESRRLGDRIELALSSRRGQEQPQQPPGSTERSTQVDAPAPPSMAEARPDDTGVTPASADEPRTEDAELPPAQPASNPLSAVPVDVPATDPDAQASDAATVAASMAAGGVVDAEPAEPDEGGALAPAEPADAVSPAEEGPSEGVLVPRPQLDQPQEVLPRRSDPTRRRRLFGRTQGS